MFGTPVPAPPRITIEEAIAALESGLDDTIEFDLRERPEILEALDFLHSRLGRTWGVEQYRAALNVPVPSTRYEAAFQALRLIKQEYWGTRR